MEKAVSDAPGKDPGTSSVLAAAALFAGLCRLVPVPLLDRILLRQVHKRMTASILNLHDIPCTASALFPLYKSGHGCLVSLLRMIFFHPFMLAARIFRRILRWLFFPLLIRDAALEMGRTILMGHTIERCLLDSRIKVPEPGNWKSSKTALRSASKCRRKFNRAFKGSDLRFIVHLFRGTVISMRRVPGLVQTAVQIIRSTDNSDIQDGLENLEKKETSRSSMLQKEIINAMNNQQMQAYIKRFDARFDEKWYGRKGIPAENK